MRTCAGTRGCAARARRGSLRRSHVAAAVSEAPVASAPPSSVWTNNWWPVSFERDLDDRRPTAFKVLDMPLVVWKDAAQEWQVLRDVCPHRLAQLSEGRVTEAGNLECPYHGWTFAGGGACVSIPQLSGDTANTAVSSPRACATAFQTKVVQGIVWVLLREPNCKEPLPPPPAPVPELDEKGFVCTDVARILPYDYTTLLENVLDVSHLPYTHHMTVSNRVNGGPVDLQLVEPVSAAGFTGLWPSGPRRGTLGPQHTIFVAPSLMYHKLTSPSFGTSLTVVYATPVSPGVSLLLARFPFRFKAWLPQLFIGAVPRFLQHQNQNLVLEDDVIFLAGQERALALKTLAGDSFAKACYMPSAQDVFTRAFREWLATFGGGGPFAASSLAAAHSASPLASPLTSEHALLDRYESHTRRCASCRSALAWTQWLRVAAAVASGVSFAVACVWMSVALTSGGIGRIFFISAGKASMRAAVGFVVSSVALIAAWYQLGVLEKGFHTGERIAPRNRQLAVVRRPPPAKAST